MSPVRILGLMVSGARLVVVVVVVIIAAAAADDARRTLDLT
jgi:hypothetical protein